MQNTISCPAGHHFHEGRMAAYAGSNIKLEFVFESNNTVHWAG